MSVQHEHSGYYTCVVESGSGSMERGANLFVLGMLFDKFISFCVCNIGIIFNFIIIVEQ